MSTTLGLFEHASKPNEPTLQQARQMGKAGAHHNERERLLHEEYLRGHCWQVGTWDSARREYFEMNSRVLFAVWRDRAALGVLSTEKQRVAV